MTVEPLRVAIRVRPGSSRTHVGGRRGDSLLVAVTSRAVDGAATDAALAALEGALGLRGRHVVLAHGARSREKVVQLDVDPADRARLLARLDELRGP